MQKTKNYNLNLPEPQDYIIIEDLNKNFITIDENLKPKADLGSDGKVLPSQLPTPVGRNLLLNSNKKIETADYLFPQIYLVEKPVVGETYTLTIQGQLGSGKSFVVNNSGAYIGLGTLAEVTQGVYSKTFTWKDTATSSDGIVRTADNTYLQIHNYPYTINTVSLINKIKLEKGSVATPWTPSYEDFAPHSHSELTAFKSFRFNAPSKGALVEIKCPLRNMCEFEILINGYTNNVHGHFYGEIYQDKADSFYHTKVWNTGDLDVTLNFAKKGDSIFIYVPTLKMSYMLLASAYTSINITSVENHTNAVVNISDSEKLTDSEFNADVIPDRIFVTQKEFNLMKLNLSGDYYSKSDIDKIKADLQKEIKTGSVEQYLFWL